MIFFFSLALANEADFSSTQGILFWSLAVFLSMVISFCYLLFAKYILFNNIKNVPIKIWQVIIFAISISLVKVLSTYGISVKLGLHSHEFISNHLLIQAIPATFVSLIIIPLFAKIDQSIRFFNDSQKKMVIQKIKLQMENHSYEQFINTQIDSVKGDLSIIFQKVKTDLEKIRNLKSFDKEWLRVSETLRTDSIDKIRIRSHELWDSNIIKKNEVGLKDFIKQGIQVNGFPLIPLVSLFFLTSILPMYIHTNYVAFITLIMHTLIILALFKLSQNKNWKAKGSPVRKYITIDAFIVLGMICNFLIISKIFNIQDNLLNYIAGIVWYLILHILVVLTFSFQGTKNEIQNKIQNDVKSEKLYLESLIHIEKRINTKISKFLHGHVQGRVMSQALQLELASNMQDSDLAIKALKELTEELVNDYGLEDLKKSSSDLELELDNVVNSWLGICDIQLCGSENIKDVDSIVSDFILDFVNEATTNSVRHGKANEVKIKFIKNENDSITAEVIDNGIGIETNKVSGLGFEIFKVLSHDDWKIENLKDAPGCKLTLKFEKLIDNLSEMEMEKT